MDEAIVQLLAAMNEKCWQAGDLKDFCIFCDKERDPLVISILLTVFSLVTMQQQKRPSDGVSLSGILRRLNGGGTNRVGSSDGSFFSAFFF